jgi:TonB family protein
MKKLLLATLALLSLMGCTPQHSALQTSSSAYKHKYVDKLEPGSTLLNSGYHFTLEKTADGQFISKTYFPDTRQITHFYTYSDEKLKVKNGKASEWWDNGSLRFEGQYIDDKREGEWKSSRSFNKTTASGFYKNGEMEGLWVERDTVGVVRSEYNYRAGKEHGPFKVWDKNGVLAREGNYVDGELESEKKYGTDGTIDLLPLAEEMPFMAGCEHPDKDAQKACSERVMLQSLYQGLRYPGVARENGLEGTAIIRFVVEKDGSITDIEVMRGLCREIAAECDSAVRRMPPWRPGKQNGEPVRVQFNLPVKFKLE